MDSSLIDKSSAHLNFGVDRRAGSTGSVFFGTSAQPASWKTNIYCPDQDTRDELMAVLTANRDQQVRLLADLNTGVGPLLVTIDAAVSSVKWPGSGDVLQVTFESDGSIWTGIDVATASKTFTSSLDQVIHLPAPGNVPTQPVIRITPTEQRSTTTAAVGWQWRQRWMIANNGDEPLFRYEVRIPLGDTTGLVSGGKALASGDDVHVWLHGLEQARTLVDWDTTDTGVWVVVPALPPGEAITYEIVYGNPEANPAAEDGVELSGADLPAHDLATSTNYEHHYLTANDVINAGKGLWPLSSPLEGGSADYGAPGAWQPALTFENPNNTDSYVQPSAQRLEDSAGPWYQARLYAARWRGDGFTNFDPYAGSDPYDGTVLHNPFGIRAVRSSGIRYRNDAYDLTTATTTVDNTTETSEVLTPHDPPYTRVVVLGRNSGGENWHVLQEYGNTTIDPLHRLYLQIVNAAPISPTPAAGWELTASPHGLKRYTAISQPTVIGSSLHGTTNTFATDDDVLIAQYVYALPPGVVFTTGDTVKGQIRASEGGINFNMRAQTVIRVMTADSTVQATLLDFDTGSLANEFVVDDETNREFPRSGPVSLAANYTSVEGDYLVIEYGARAHSAGGVHVAEIALGVTGSVDLPEDEVEDEAFNPWIEFSTDLSGEGYVTDSPAWTPPTPVKHFGVAVWPQGVVSIPEDAESRVSVEATGDITVHIAAENLIVAQIEPETEIYELATELRLHGGGNAVGPYSVLLIGNARSMNGPGTPRAAVKLGTQGLEIDTERHTHQVYDTTFTTRAESLSAHTVRALAGSLREVDATDIPALERIPQTVPNSTFDSDLTGWELHQDDGDWTYAVTHDAVVGGEAAGSLEFAVTVSDASTVLWRSTTYIAVEDDDSLEVVCWLRQDATGSSSPRLGVAWYDATPTLIQTDLDGMSAALLNPGADHTLVFAGVPPAGATQGRIVLGVTASGDTATTKYFDDVEAAIVRPLRYDGSLAKVTEEARSSRWLPIAPPRRSVPNGTFDTDIGGWALESAGAGITQTTSWDGTVGGEALGALKTAISGNSGTGDVIYRTSGFFAVNGAQRVQMSAWCVTDDEDVHPRQSILWYGDASDTALATSLEADWQPVEDAEYVRAFAAIVPEGMTRFRLALVADTAVSMATGTVLWDDVRLNDNCLLIAEVSMAELEIAATVLPRWTP